MSSFFVKLLPPIHHYSEGTVGAEGAAGAVRGAHQPLLSMMLVAGLEPQPHSSCTSSRAPSFCGDVPGMPSCMKARVRAFVILLWSAQNQYVPGSVGGVRVQANVVMSGFQNVILASVEFDSNASQVLPVRTISRRHLHSPRGGLECVVLL